MTVEVMLPEEFSDLEPYAPVWAHADPNVRYEQRRNSSMADMQAFYDVAVPRVEAALAYLDQFDLDDMPTEAENLLWLLGSLSAVGFAVDVFRQPTVPDAANGRLDWVRTPVP